MDKVSIIVPVYNAEAYLERCVASLTGQTYQNLEILLIDDGSADHSGQMCDELACQDDRIVVLHQPNQGVSAARNLGLDAMTGDWVCFCDSDDWFAPEFVEKMLRCAQTEQADYILCDRYLAWERTSPIPGNHLRDLHTGCDRRSIIAYGPISSWGHLIHASLFHKTAVRYPVSCKQYEELPVIPVLAAAASRIGVVNEPLYYYYQRCDGTSASNMVGDTRRYFLDSMQLLRQTLGNGYRMELDYHTIYALHYGMTLSLCKQGASGQDIKAELARSEALCPDYLRNPYVKKMGFAKRAFLWCAKLRLIFPLRVFAALHSRFVG